MSDVQRDPGARVIYILSIALVAPIIIIALARGADIGAGTTICLLIAAASVIGLVIDWRHRVRLPRARVIHRRRRSTVPPSHGHRVLVVEDEPALQELLRQTLTPRGIDVVLASTLAEGLRAIEARPELVLLDLGLPDGDGLELLRAVREHDHTPVLVISARDREDDRTRALDAGADDYVMKPFDAGALATRVQRALRRPSSHLTLPEGVLLGTREQAVLSLLARRRGALVGYRELLDEVWGPGNVHEVTELRLLVASLRRKIERDPARPRWLVAEAGGYRLRDDR